MTARIDELERFEQARHANDDDSATADMVGKPIASVMPNRR